MMRIVREFLSLCLKGNITFEVRHIKGSNNVLADAGSRWGLNAAHNMLDQITLDYCFTVLGFIPLVDCFASRENTRCVSFISPCPDSSLNCVGIDALKTDWTSFPSIYAFPPPLLLPLVLEKIENYPGKGILIAPYLNNSVLPGLMRRARWAEPLPKSYFLFQMRGKEVIHRRKFYDLWMWVL